MRDEKYIEIDEMTIKSNRLKFKSINKTKFQNQTKISTFSFWVKLIQTLNKITYMNINP